MKMILRKSERYQGYKIDIDAEKESLRVENPAGTTVAQLVLEDFLDRLGGIKHEFKREYPRLELGTHIKYYDPEGQPSEAIASSIGGGGLFIDQFSPPEMGTPIRLEITLPASGRTIRAESKVVWVRKSLVEKVFYPGMGLQFTSISDKDRKEILQFIKKFIQQRAFQEP